MSTSFFQVFVDAELYKSKQAVHTKLEEAEIPPNQETEIINGIYRCGLRHTDRATDSVCVILIETRSDSAKERGGSSRCNILQIKHWLTNESSNRHPRVVHQTDEAGKNQSAERKTTPARGRRGKSHLGWSGSPDEGVPLVFEDADLVNDAVGDESLLYELLREAQRQASAIDGEVGGGALVEHFFITQRLGIGCREVTRS